MRGMRTFNETDVIRRPTGPGAGQFMEHLRSAPEVGLSGGADPLQARRDALRAAGFTPSAEVMWAKADTVPAATDGYELIPKGFGRVKAYAGTQTSVKMPSANAIRRFARETGGTFDIPVEADTPAGRIGARVRVTHNGGMRWSVSVPGHSGELSDYLAESVSAVLEARQPVRSLAETRDILARRRERIAAAGVKVQPLRTASTWIDGAGYNPAEEQLVVTMNGRSYGYHVSPETYEEFLGAPSPGAAYNRLVKGEPRFELGFHESCGRYYRAEQRHRCPSRHTAPKHLAHA